MHLDIASAREQEDAARVLLPEHLEERRRAEPEEAVDRTGGHDPQLALAADARLAVHLDEDLSLQDAEDLVGAVVAVEVADVVCRDGLDPHDQTMQAVTGTRDVPDLVASPRERHQGPSRESMRVSAPST
jgi:hypothetical protein